jgi:hypothetical protein
VLVSSIVVVVWEAAAVPPPPSKERRARVLGRAIPIIAARALFPRALLLLLFHTTKQWTAETSFEEHARARERSKPTRFVERSSSNLSLSLS